MILLRLLMVCRPFWQLSILLLYSYGANAWERACLALLGAVYIATNLLLGTTLDHLRWSEVRRWTLLTEAVATLLGCTFLVFMWPLGPVSLLLLPALVTYAWLFERDSWQWLLLVAMAFVYFVCVRFGLNATVAANIAFQQSSLPPLVLALYGGIVIFGTLLAFLLQFQKAEGHRLYEAMQRVEQQSKQLSRVNEQMNNYAEQIYELATAEERNRIAGEIHDTVAHRLTALLVQLQAARRIISSEGDIAAATTNLEVCEALARESLDEVRYSVRAIHRDAANEGLELLHRLAVHYASLTGMQIEFRHTQDVAALPAQIVAVLYRVMQEALTNAQRHGRATRVMVDLRREGTHLHFDVSDNGRGSADNMKGFGLSTMTERVRQLGGDIAIETTPGSGFRLLLKLPMWEGVSA